MIIELSNGKDRLFQWDKGQKVKISGDIPTVHFKWGDEGVPFEVVDGWVEIAPELTQKAGYILLWTYKKDHTLDAARIPVEKRPKPAGYAYTPTEIKTWEQLDARIEALEKGGGVAGVSSVNGQTGAVTITASGIGAATPDEVTSTVNSAWAEAQKTLEPLFDAKQPKGDYITQDGLQTATNAALAQAKASGEFDGAQGPKGDPGATGPQGPAGAGLNVTGATVGQTVKISAVDDNGVPTAWVPVDMGGGGDYILLYNGAITVEDTQKIEADLLVSCEGMTQMIAEITWTANETAGAENKNDNLSLYVGTMSIGYGRVGDATKGKTCIATADVVKTADANEWQTFFRRSDFTVGPKYNTSDVVCGISPHGTPVYDKLQLKTFALSYTGTITITLWGR
nr:MAG TPA: nucleoid-associated protein [Caudoviricetes sp.]